MKPGNKVIRIDADGGPRIEAYRCSECGAVVSEQTMACRACASRTLPRAFRAAETGTLYSWSVVERSYPGVQVPFVSAIVDLDDGLTLDPSAKFTPAAYIGSRLRYVMLWAGQADLAPETGVTLLEIGRGSNPARK